MSDDSLLPICAGEREYLLERSREPAILALWYFTGGESRDGQVSERSRKAHRHIKGCTACREWFHSLVPQALLKRQNRMSRYCCASMYYAVEEYDKRPKNRFEFTMFRGEDPCWKIDGVHSFASFCPWCGAKLPEQPFVGPCEP